MLKKIIINSRSIPVPVPVKDLSEALKWVDTTFLQEEEMITRVVFDGRDLTEEGVDVTDYKKYPLTEVSDLEIRIDSPLELTNQSIETLRNLATVVDRELKPMAVTCWQTTPARMPDNFDGISADFKLIVELGEHISSLVDSRIDLSILKYLIEKFSATLVELDAQAENRRWQEYARVLLNKLEPIVVSLLEETTNLQVALYSHMSDVAMCKGMK